MLENLKRIRKTLFRNMLETIHQAQTGHLGACCSSLDLMTALYFTDILRMDIWNPAHPLRDYVLVRGHLGPLRYNIFHLLGWMKKEEMSQYRQFGSRLQGHEDMKTTPGVDITPSGSLGMLLSCAVGACVGFRDKDMPNRVFCFLGDGEEEEGNVSEAARHASHLKLKNLICVIDKNGGQLSTRLPHTDSGADLEKIWSGYGWQVIAVADGHNLQEVYDAYRKATLLCKNGPVCIIANTVKGNGIPGAEQDYSGFHVLHGSEVKDARETVREIDIESVLRRLQDEGDEPYEIPIKTLPYFQPKRYAALSPVRIKSLSDAETVVQYDVEESFLRSLEREIGERLYVLTSDYPPRSFVYGTGGRFEAGKAHYHNVGLREQHMTAMAHGIHCVRKEAVVVILCGDAFLYRHADQINILAQAKTPIVFFSVQGGLSGAKNGSTHQSSGQSGAMLTMPGLATEEPCTAEQFLRSCNEAIVRDGPTYIRLQKLPVRWSFRGTMHKGYEVVNYTGRALGTIIACGMTAIEAFEAFHELKSKKLEYNLLILTSLSECQGVSNWISPEKPLFLFYNGNPEILESVVARDLLRNLHCFPDGVISRGFELGTTGSIKELLRRFQMDKESIIQTCLKETKAFSA